MHEDLRLARRKPVRLRHMRAARLQRVALLLGGGRPFLGHGVEAAQGLVFEQKQRHHRQQIDGNQRHRRQRDVALP